MSKLSITSVVKLTGNVDIPIFGLGTYLSKGEDCYNACVAALKHGYIHIDTAQMYQNEEEVGKAIIDSKIDRKKLFITTKLPPGNFSEEIAYKSLLDSLAKLQTSYVDLVLLHAPGMPIKGKQLTSSEQKTIAESNKKLRKSAWEALEKLHESGKARAIGVSNFWPQHIEEIMSYAKVKPCINQIEYHPWNQRLVQVKYCKENSIVIEGWGPFAKNQILEDETLKKIAAHYNKTVAQICVRWSLQKDVICIPKSTRESRIVENSDVFDWEITNEDMKAIDAMHKSYLSVNFWEHDDVP
jgi:diketogulonate reductase-like aldo/keto reductase